MALLLWRSKSCLELETLRRWIGYLSLYICGIFDTLHIGLSKLGAPEAEQYSAGPSVSSWFGPVIFLPMVDMTMMY